MSSKLREALEQIHKLLSIGGKPDTAMCIRYEAANQIAKEALAEPLRNCDVGTDEEQAERFKVFCNSHPLMCDECPLKDVGCLYGDCVIYWAHMPYEEVRK